MVVYLVFSTRIAGRIKYRRLISNAPERLYCLNMLALGAATIGLRPLGPILGATLLAIIYAAGI